MSPEERRQGAFADFDELLAEGLALDEAVLRAAENNELKPEIFRTIAEQQLGDLCDYSRKLQLRALNAAITAEVEIAVSKRHPKHAFRNCFELNEVAAKVEGRVGRSLNDDEISRIEDAYRDFIMRSGRELAARLG